MRSCIETGCGRLTSRTRCTEHERGRERGRGTPSARGYDHGYQKRRIAAISAEPWCHWGGGCRYPDVGTYANPLTADHVVPIALGGRDGPLTVLCKRHNSGKRDRVQ